MHNKKPYGFGRSTLVVLAALTIAAFFVGGEQPAISQSAGYTTITDLGTLGGAYSYANGVNNSGQVVGRSPTTGGQDHAFLFSGGVMYNLGTLGGTYSYAFGINDSGHVAGYAATASGSWPHAFLWTPSQMRDLGLLTSKSSYSFGFGINNSDQVVGEADRTQTYIQHAFLWQNGKMTDLGTLGGASWHRAKGINNIGQVTGFSVLRSGLSRTFLYQNGKMYDLGALAPGDSASGNGINDSGQVVGGSGPPQAVNAFVWTPFQPNGTSGSMVNIHPLSGVTSSNAVAINTFTSVVGDATDSAGNGFAFIWDSVNGMRNLNDLIPPGSGWVLQLATSINDLEQIAGTGTHNGQTRAFLLTP